jgi:drug/metabolite transporter (DMT)-like permease
MANHNPYAPSRASLKQADKPGDSSEVRRDGKWVVMPINASLPPRCVKCNAEADQPTKERKLYWHHPGIYLLLLINLLVYAIVAAIVRKQVRVSPGMCQEHKLERRNILLIGWVGVAVAFAAPMTFANDHNMGLWVLFSVLLFLGVILFAMIRGRIVYAKRIEADEVRLGGCGRDFLDSLPEY